MTTLLSMNVTVYHREVFKWERNEWRSHASQLEYEDINSCCRLTLLTLKSNYVKCLYIPVSKLYEVFVYDDKYNI